MYKTYAISDLHGRYDIWEKVKNFIDDTDTIYFLGDAIDRGTGGLKLMMELLDDPRVIYIKGNHEDMMTRVFSKNFKDITSDTPEKMRDLHLWTDYNGGDCTYHQLMGLSKDERLNVLNKVMNLPYFKWYGDIFLSHAGCYSDDVPAENDEIDMFKKQDLLWNRDHLYMDDNCEYADCMMIFGHTPIEDQDEIKYYDGMKIDIDMGTYWTGRTVLFDLDTFEENYIDGDKEIC